MYSPQTALRCISREVLERLDHPQRSPAASGRGNLTKIAVSYFQHIQDALSPKQAGAGRDFWKNGADLRDLESVAQLFDGRRFVSFEYIERSTGISKYQSVALKPALEILFDCCITSRIDLVPPGLLLEQD